MIFLAVVVSAGSALAFSARKTPIYEASAKIFIGYRSAGEGDVSAALQELTAGDRFMTSYAEVLQSQPVAQKVIDRERLPRSPHEVADSIEARVIPETRIIEVKYTDADPVRAQKATNSLVDIFVEEEVKDLGGGEAVSARLLEPAQLPTEPVSPKPLRDGVLGLVLGLALGVGMAFLLQQLDTTLRTREDAEEALAPLPVLAGIPKAAATKERSLFFENDTRSPASEAIRTLRTNIQFFSIDNPIRLLLITSPYAADGKTTVAANLGAAIAASGVKTLLLEADLRRPALREYFDYFEPEKKGGLTDVLAGIDRIRDVVRKTHIPNLYFLPAGSLPPNPSELLGSHKMEEVLAEVREMADVVVIDTPPALAVADSLVLGAHTDGVALVIRAGVTHRERSREAKEVFERAGIRILGMVLNDLDLSDAQYYYRYYQRYTPRHRQEKMLTTGPTRSQELLATSGLQPSPPPKAIQKVTAPDPEVVATGEDATPPARDKEQSEVDEEGGNTLARLRAVRRLMEDDDLLKKVSAADHLSEKVDEDPGGSAGEVTLEVVEPEPAADSEAQMELEPEPEEDSDAAASQISSLFPPESAAPSPAPPPPDRPIEVPAEAPSRPNGPLSHARELDPEVLRMMREEEGEFEDESDLPSWITKDDKDDDHEEEPDASDDLELLGVDVTQLTPKQRKRLRKRVHRLGPDAATQEFR